MGTGEATALRILHRQPFEVLELPWQDHVCTLLLIGKSFSTRSERPRLAKTWLEIKIFTAQVSSPGLALLAPILTRSCGRS